LADYGSWTTEALIEATALKQEDYLPEAIAAMRTELAARGVAQDHRSEVAGVMQEVETKRLSGVRGWIIVFLIVLALNSLVALVSGLAAIQSGGFLLSWLGLAALALAVYGGFVFAVLVAKKHSAPAHAKRWIVIMTVLGVLSAFLVLLVTGEFSMLFVTSAVFALIWWRYFDVSKCVAATYGTRQK